MGETEELMTESHNILFLANSGEIIGGGQISLLGLLENLNIQKYHPIVICPMKGDLYFQLVKLGVETYIVKMDTLRNLSFISWIVTVIKLFKIINKKKIDLIHSNGSRATIYGGIAAKISGIPLIWHVRIADCDKILDRILARFSTKIIAISNAVNKRFDWLKDNSKKTIVYNGIDIKKFNPSVNGEKIRKEFHITKKKQLVGIVGRLDWYKGHKFFLNAAKAVSEELPQVNFIIVGEGEKRITLEKQVKQLNIEDKVTFTGKREEIPEIIASLDLFVLSSVSEGFGRVVAEAMACGKPVVASNIGGLPEVVVDQVTGILVPMRNPVAIAKAIIEILNNKSKAEQMGRAGRKRVEKLFSLTENVSKTELLYEKILKK